MSYTFNTLADPLGGTGSVRTIAMGINVAGQVVGYFYDSNLNEHGFLYKTGSYTTIDAPNAFTTSASGINASGQIVGLSHDSNGNHGFLFSGGSYTTIDYPLNTYPFVSSLTYASGINDAGQIVGGYWDSGQVDHGFVKSGDSFTTIDDPLGTFSTNVYGISKNGQIVGSYREVKNVNVEHGFYYSNGTYTTIDDPLGVESVANGINAAGQIVGWYKDNGGRQHGFLYDSGAGTYTTIDDPLGTGATALNGINDSGQIVGQYVDSAGLLQGFIATSGSSTVQAQQIQNDYMAIARTSLSLNDAASIAATINSGSQTEAQYIDSLISSVADTTGAALLLHSFIEGTTPGSASLDGLTATATNLITQANGLPNASWQQMGASLADSAFNSAYLSKYASLGVPDLVRALHQDIFGSLPDDYVLGYFENLVVYYANWFKHFTDARDPTGYTRAEGTLIGDMLEEAMDISWGKYPAAEKAWLQAAANGSPAYGGDLLASHSNAAIQVVGTGSTIDQSQMSWQG